MKRHHSIQPVYAPKLPDSSEAILSKILGTKDSIMSLFTMQNIASGFLIITGFVSLNIVLRNLFLPATLNALGSLSTPPSIERFDRKLDQQFRFILSSTLASIVLVGLYIHQNLEKLYDIRQKNKELESKKFVSQRTRDIFTEIYPFISRSRDKDYLVIQEECCAAILKYVVDDFSAQSPDIQKLLIIYALYLDEFVDTSLVSITVNKTLNKYFSRLSLENFWIKFEEITGASRPQLDNTDRDYFFIFEEKSHEIFVIHSSYFKSFILKRFSSGSVNIDNYYKYDFFKGDFVFNEGIAQAFSKSIILQNVRNFIFNEPLEVILRYFFGDYPDVLASIKVAMCNSTSLNIKLLGCHVDLSKYHDHDRDRLKSSCYNFIMEVYKIADQQNANYLIHALGIFFVGMSSERFLGNSNDSCYFLRELGRICLNSILPNMHLREIIQNLSTDYCSATIANELFVFYPKQMESMKILRSVIPMSWWSGNDLSF